MLEMMEPGVGGEAGLDAWYREERDQQLSKQPGWWRTSRHDLVAHYASGELEDISFLAIHEFGEGHQLGIAAKALEPMSDRAKTVDTAIYSKQKQIGKTMYE